MIQKRAALWSAEEYTYPVIGNFVPFIMTYIHDEDDTERPAVVVVPGGAYCAVAPTEGEIVAKRFYDKGYNTFVVTYSTNLNMDTPLKFQPLKDISRAFVWVRKNAAELHVKTDAVAICGFSAGGHLSSSLCVHYDVPCENSFLYADALRKAGIPVELHVFGNGPHGMSLADDTWAYDGLKAYYCMDQMLEIFQYMVDNGQPLPEPYNAAGPVPKGTDVKQMFGIMIEQNPQKVGEPDPAIAKWPDLADEWLKKQRA